MTDEGVHVIIRQGDGIVARYGSGLLAILPGGSDAVQQQLLDALKESCESQDLPGRTMARRLVGILSQAEPDDVPPFGACAPNERGWAVILHQGVALSVDRGGEATRVSGFDASTWVDRIVDGGFDSLTLLPDAEEVGAVDARFRFQGGLVPGSGATLMVDGASPPSGAMAAKPATEAAPEPAAEAVAEPTAEEAAPAADAPADDSMDDDAGHDRATIGSKVPVAPATPPAPPAPPAPAAPAAAPAAPVAPIAAPAPVAAAPPPAPAPAPTPAGAPDSDEPPTLIQPNTRDAETPVAAPDAELPGDDEPSESIPLTDIGPEAKREPLAILSEDTPKDEVADDGAPLVLGVLSPAGYFNHPDALYCAVTGVSMLHRTHVLVQRPRPPLGVVVAPDGSTFTLNSDYVVGREPERDPKVEGGQARPLKLTDTERSLSRVHAEINLVDWDVFVVDRGSNNGTYVLPRNGQQWKRLVVDTPEKITPGTRLAFGKLVMTFESHHQINQAAAT